jgi:hypothetical protein
MITLTSPQWIETYTHIAQEIGARYHCVEDFESDEWVELCNFAEEIMHSAGINMDTDHAKL